MTLHKTYNANELRRDNDILDAEIKEAQADLASGRYHGEMHALLRASIRHMRDRRIANFDKLAQMSAASLLSEREAARPTGVGANRPPHHSSSQECPA